MEGVPVQPFHQNPKSGVVPLEDIAQRVSAIAECEYAAGIRVEMEFQFDDRGQSGIALVKNLPSLCPLISSSGSNF